MALNIKKTPAQAKAIVSKELKESGKPVAEESQQESPDLGEMSAPKVAGVPWCEVGFESSYTHNLGNYQSCRVAVHLTVPCQHGEINKVYEVAKEWVNKRMESCVAELEAE